MTMVVELQAALIASCYNLRRNRTKYKRHFYFWTESKTVLKYICNENKSFPVYIMYGISEIRTNSNIKD